MKKIDSEFFMIYKEPVEFYDSAIGVNELAKVFNRTRNSILRSLKKSYIKYNNEKYIIIRESDLQKGV